MRPSANSAGGLKLLEMVQEITNEEAYDAEEAGLIFDITNSSQSSPCCGLRLNFKVCLSRVYVP
jgi:hypothetical protein